MSEEFILVRKGDTFQGLALENSISVSSLKKINHIYGGGNSSLFVGQKLKIKEDLKIKEEKEPPSSSLLAEASRTKILKKGSSSGSINWKGSVKSPPSASTSTSTSAAVYDFITSSLWGSTASKKNVGKLSTTTTTGASATTSTHSKKVSGSSDRGGQDKEGGETETLSAGFRPRAGSGVGIEDIGTGSDEVIFTMPLTKSADFKKAEPQADVVVVEPFSEAKKRNEHIKSAVLQKENNKTIHVTPTPTASSSTSSSSSSSSSSLIIEGQTLIDPEFDAELVEVNEQYFSSSSSSSPSKRGGSAGSGSGAGGSKPKSTSSKPRSPRNGGLRSRSKSFIKVDMQGNGSILSQAQAQALSSHLPAIFHANKWTLLYSVLNNGADLFSFYKLTKGAKATIIVVETVEGDVFGGFAVEQWHVDASFYGSGESFIFKVVDKKNVKIFKWSMENHFVMWSNETQIAMGGGGNGFAFALDCDFYSGQSSRSATFNNDPLVACEDHSFFVKNVEVWKLEACI